MEEDKDETESEDEQIDTKSKRKALPKVGQKRLYAESSAKKSKRGRAKK
jgi:hypothetical protein